MTALFMAASALLLILNTFLLGMRTNLLLPSHSRPGLMRSTQIYASGVLLYFFTITGASEAIKIKSLKKWDHSINTSHFVQFFVTEKLSDAFAIGCALAIAFGRIRSLSIAAFFIALLIIVVFYWKKSIRLSLHLSWISILSAVSLSVIALGIEYSALGSLLYFFNSSSLNAFILPALTSTWLASLPPWPWGKWATYPAVMSTVWASQGASLTVASQISVSYLIVKIVVAAFIAATSLTPWKRKLTQ